MISRRTHTAITVFCLIIGTMWPFASMSAAQADDLRSAVIFAAARSLGADQKVKLEYADDLASERVVIEKEFFCSDKHSLKPLSIGVTQKIVDRTLDSLDNATFAAIINDRPSYVTDLIVTAVASFELGRVLSISASEAAKICAPAATATDQPSAPVNDPNVANPPVDTTAMR